MANIKAGTAYIDVKLGSVEDLKAKLKEKMEEAGGDSGSSAGEKFSEKFSEEVTKTTTTKVKKKVSEEFKKTGDDAASNFTKSFSERVGRSAAILRGNAIAFLLPAFVAAGPFIGAALGGAILAGLPLAAIAGGIALISKDPVLNTVALEFWDKFKIQGASAAIVLLQPVVDAFKLLEKRLPEIMKPLHGMFLGSAGLILPLTNALINFLLPVLEGINVAIQKGKPVFDVFLKGLERLGVVIGDFFKKLVSDPEAIEGMADALDDLFGIIVLVVKWFGNFILSASKAYAQFKDAWGGIKSWFTGTIVPSLTRAWEQLKDVFSAIGDFFKWWWDRFTGDNHFGWDQVKGAFTKAKAFIGTTLSSIVTTFGSIPGKVVNALSSLGSRLYSAGVNAMKGFLGGLGDMAGAVLGKARSIADQVISTISSALRIGSPSKVMEQIGKWTMEGFVNGMDAMTPAIANSMPAPIQNVSNFGSPASPQMDRSPGAGITVNNTVYGDVDPWRQAEDMYFVLTARGGIA
jgi:hypothetical protein